MGRNGSALKKPMRSIIDPVGWINTHSGEDVENNGSVFTLESCCGPPVHRVVEDGSEK